ncbi:hypothetical protein YDYSG_23450 [Paenibacillus tyrfis]|uniref:hypothetical protein n=1 Tax=Paenibacillus tyrfis TaxID=1501230 RepID=UPI0024929C5C|nr:hypothetical protein [Paenibacillus tyrfis]GLI06315.1 hypothetical protein YDYSG_23450 [Paenibacillus tyrfis]
MNVNIIGSRMTHSKESGYVGHVEFQYEGHEAPYEITLHSKNAKDWSYSLIFSKESGSEEDILAVEERLEEDDDFYDLLVNAALQSLPRQEG